MIGYLRGRLAFKQPPALVVDVNGVGYECEAPMSTFFGLPVAGADVALYTHLVVREDAHVLYAFATDQERRLFRSLLKVSGIGPRIALGVLSGISVEGFLACIEAKDEAPLVRLPGVGKKTAERLLIEMRDRVKEFGVTAGQPVSVLAGEAAGPHSEAYSALIALGYRPAEVLRLLRAVDEKNVTTEELIRRALKVAAG